MAPLKVFCICPSSRSACAKNIVKPAGVIPKTGDQVFRPIKYPDYLVINVSTAKMKKRPDGFLPNIAR